MPILPIYYGNRPVAELGVTAAGLYSLTYNSSWVSNGFAVSVALPLCEQPHEGDAVRAYFENLLPEGRIREALSRRYGVDRHNIYGLLEHIGRDCAGAFSIGGVGNQGRYEALSDADVEQQLPAAGDSLLRDITPGTTLSLAGAQDKMVLFRAADGRFYLPRDGAASNCILKTPIQGLPLSVENEHLCMSLAAAIGLSVAQTEILRLPHTAVLLIRRFDRQGDGFHPQRLSQEDFCQMSACSPALKYERDGGPGFADCAELIRRYSCRGAADLLMLVRWAAFNLCIGNNDAHGKNISMLRNGHGLALAPFYDLISTTYYGRRLSRKLAMSIGGEKQSFWVSRGRWERLAADINLPAKAVLRTVQQTAAKLSEALPTLEAASAIGAPAEALVRHISARTAAVLQHL